MVQSLLLYGVMQLCTSGIGGAVGWQLPGLMLAACAGGGHWTGNLRVGGSLFSSGHDRSSHIDSQILFSGFAAAGRDMKAGPYSFQADAQRGSQSVMDTSLFWQKKISGSMRVDYPSAFSNLNRDKSLRMGRFVRTRNPRGGGAWDLAWLGQSAHHWAAWLAPSRQERG